MNREMILRVADAIEAAAKPEAKPVFGFNMNTFGADSAEVKGGDRTGHGCKTVGCIAGWAVALRDDGLPVYYTDADQQARKLFGLDHDDADNLFWAWGVADLQDIAPGDAVAVLRHLAETGEVDWSIAARDQIP